MTSTSYRRMLDADIKSVVKIHKTAFEGFFLEQMGTPFLRAYYHILLNYSGSIAHVYIGRNNTIEGFAVGFIDPAGFYKEFKRSVPKLIFPILFGIINNPKLLYKIFENIKRVSHHDTSDNQELLGHDTAELSSIAVINKASGIGSILLNRFIEDVCSNDILNITLTTDSKNNELVNKFYLKHGFKKSGLEVRKGRELCRYVLSDY